MKITKKYYEELCKELEMRKMIRNSAVKAEAQAWHELMSQADDESRRYRKEAKDQ